MRYKFENNTKQTRIPIPGGPAPQFEAESTYGIIRLNDFQGKWLIVFSHPTDFCPTWANEIRKFASYFCELRNLNCDLLGVGTVDLQSPLMWSKAVQEEFGVKIWFPVILDNEHELAKSLGMLEPGDEPTAIKRSICIIDDKQILRSIVYYDLSYPDTLEEIIRLVKFLQSSNASGIVRPESWRPGDEWVLQGPETEIESAETEKEMWYF